MIGLAQSLTEGLRPPELGANAPAVVPEASLRRDGAGGCMPGAASGPGGMKPIKRDTP